MGIGEEPAARAARQRIRLTGEEQAVTPLELFFDLVFVFALTQVTALLSTHLTTRGVVEGMVVLALVWWCWVGFSWLGNTIRADEGVARAAFILVMAAMFVASLAIPESFSDLPGGLDGPVVLAVCYAVVRLVHLGFYAFAAWSSGDAALMRQLARFGGVTAASIALILAGAVAGGNVQLLLWCGAVAVDYVGTQAIGASGWRLSAPRHFSERHGLIVIIALGESIVSIGVGASAEPVSWPLVAAAVLGIALASAMWWVYFDVSAIAAERRLSSAEGVERARLARDAYSYLHLPMVAGIVIAALGLKKVLSYVAGSDGHEWTESLDGIPVWAMHGGPALYLAALVAFRLRNIGSLSRSRTVAVVALLATAPLGEHVGALADLGLTTAILALLVAFEVVRYEEARRRIRYEGDHHPVAEAAEN